MENDAGPMHCDLNAEALAAQFHRLVTESLQNSHKRSQFSFPNHLSKIEDCSEVRNHRHVVP